MKRIVFISHSSADRQIAEQVCAYLEKNRVGCWMAPRDVTPGKNYGAAIVDAIDECQVFVLLLSSQSNKSRQVVREVERAASADSVILPFRIEDVQPSRDIAFYVSAAHWLDAAKHPVEEQFDELLRAIRDWQKAEPATEQTLAPPEPQPSTPPPTPQIPPPLPTQPSPTPISSPPPGRGFPMLPVVIIAAAIVLGVCSFLFYKLSRQRIVKPAVSLQIPTPTASPFLATPEPSATAAEPLVTEASPSAMETPPPPPPPLTTPPPLRLKPGGRLHPSAPPEYSPATATPPNIPQAPAISSGPGAVKGPVVREIAASSQFNDEFRPNLAFDGNPATAWVPKGRAIGQTLFANFKSPAVVRSVSILNGDGRDEEHYRDSNRVRALRIVLSDGTNQLLTFKDEMKMQRFELQKPVTATWVKFEIVSVFPGKTKKTGISEIVFNEGE